MYVRVYYRGSEIVNREHRKDEQETGDRFNPKPGLGKSAYTQENMHPLFSDCEWIVIDINEVYDEIDEIPFEAISVNTSTKKIVIDESGKDRIRLDRKNRTKGEGGRIDFLTNKLKDNTITDSEQKELLRLEKGL